ncbi:prevent-host-death protein, partial [Vibrio cholerae]|nr:prevent-host-death protein [Vibrio cholerae]EGR4481987.1 prevent-host-death protein [Vibrio cholerae]
MRSLVMHTLTANDAKRNFGELL